MKNFFKKFRNYGFYVALSGAVIVFLNALGKAFGFTIENQVVEDCILSFASILVVLGIVTSNKTAGGNTDDKNDDKNEENLDQNDENDDEF